VVLSDQGKYKVAKEMHQQKLRLKKVLSPEHLQILVSMNTSH
jgi:hypothetical protein